MGSCIHGNPENVAKCRKKWGFHLGFSLGSVDNAFRRRLAVANLWGFSRQGLSQSALKLTRKNPRVWRNWTELCDNGKCCDLRQFCAILVKIQDEQGKSSFTVDRFYTYRTACCRRGPRPFELYRGTDAGESKNQVAGSGLPQQPAPTPGGLGDVR